MKRQSRKKKQQQETLRVLRTRNSTLGRSTGSNQTIVHDDLKGTVHVHPQFQAADQSRAILDVEVRYLVFFNPFVKDIRKNDVIVRESGSQLTVILNEKTHDVQRVHCVDYNTQIRA